MDIRIMIMSLSTLMDHCIIQIIQPRHLAIYIARKSEAFLLDKKID